MSVDLVVVGLGRVGTPLALLAASRGLSVVGLDVDPKRVDALNAGVDPFGDEDGLGEMLMKTLQGDCFSATTDAAGAIGHAAAIIVAVPLWLNGNREPNFDYLDSAASTIGTHVQPGSTVIFETTQPVGTTANRYAPRLAEMSALTLGESLFVAFSPERIKVGHIFRDLDRYPKLVGGVDKASTSRAADVYRGFLPEVWTVPNSATAEFVKLAETSYRDLNIALAHELADAADAADIDFAEVRRAANSQPESDLHSPGIGVGGHCIPVYPYLFMHSTPGLELIAHGRTLNESRPGHYADLIESALGVADLSGHRIAVLGAAYRPELGLVTHSSVFALVDQLVEKGAVVETFEPYATNDELTQHGLTPGSLGRRYDAVVLHTAHEQFKDKKWHRLAPLFIDGRGLLAESAPEGVRYIAPGYGFR